MTERPESDPQRHTDYVRGQLDELIKHLREDITKVKEPQAKALFETTAEVLGGLVKAFEHYEEASEAAWEED